MSELFGNQSYETDEIAYKTKTVTTQGDVSVNTRKKKTFLFYELDISIPFEGNLKSNASTTYKGTVQLPYISEENDDDDFEVITFAFQFPKKNRSNSQSKETQMTINHSKTK
jgi:activator of HSP90 ATPase